MKVLVLVTALLAMTSASATVKPNNNVIIDPPQVDVAQNNMTPGASTFEDTIVRTASAEEEVEEFDPNAPDASEVLKQFIQDNRDNIDLPENYNNIDFGDLFQPVGGCYRESCAVYIEVNLRKAKKQYGVLWYNGVKQGTFPVSGAGHGRRTRTFDGHPGGAFAPGRHDSSIYPSGYGWKGLGNMPYAMFYSGNYALHGTPAIGKLGRADSHGCVRMDPVLAGRVNQVARQVGRNKVWFYIHY